MKRKLESGGDMWIDKSSVHFSPISLWDKLTIIDSLREPSRTYKDENGATVKDEQTGLLRTVAPWRLEGMIGFSTPDGSLVLELSSCEHAEMAAGWAAQLLLDVYERRSRSEERIRPNK